MESIKNLGNIEFLNCFLAWHYRKFGLFKENIAGDPRINLYKEEFEDFIDKLLGLASEETVHNVLCEEAKARGLGEKFEIGTYGEMGLVEGLTFSEEVWEWQECMLKNPTYIREIMATNNFGDSSVDDDRGLSLLDMPVREACKILNERGYLTYWSSANREDFKNRRGNIIQDKSVAYILIDPKNLTDELKQKLYLNGKCVFRGLAIGHNDLGKYYGIWVEIPSIDTMCVDLSRDLSSRALELPSLVNAQRMGK